MKIVGFGEVMMRLNTTDMVVNDYINTYIGGAEYNVLANLSSLGLSTSMATVLPENELGKKVKLKASGYDIDFSKVKYCGEKLGMYFTIEGSEFVPMKVLYDRKYSSFYNYEEFNIDEILDDCSLIHVSGVTAALNQNLRNTVLQVVVEAKRRGIKVSYDSNYRAKLWTQAEAGEFLEEVLPYCDYAFLGILDMQFLLNYEINDLETGYARLFKEFPNLAYACSTTREIINQRNHKMVGHVYNGETLTTSKEYNVNIEERVGTGDSFTAGCLFGIINKFNERLIAEYGICNNVLKHYYKGDNYFANEDHIKMLIENRGGKIDR